MYELVGKLNNLKGMLKQLNREKFSQIERKAEETQEELLKCQNRMQIDPSNQNIQEEEAKLLRKNKRLNKAKHQFLRQRSKVMWIEKGDLNTKYFHSIMKKRRNMNRIFSITDDQGVNRIDLDEIRKAFIEFYTKLL